MNSLKFRLLHPAAQEPKRAHPGDLGFDMRAIERVYIPVGSTICARTGVAAQFPAGWGALVLVRSSQGKIGLHSTSQVVDGGYRGELHVVICNSGQQPITYEVGERIGQLVPIPEFVLPAYVVESFDDETARGTAGFGSTGS